MVKMGTVLPAASTSGRPNPYDGVLLEKLRVVEELMNASSLAEELTAVRGRPYSYEMFCQDLDVRNVYTRRLLELLIKETATKARRRADVSSNTSFEHMTRYNDSMSSSPNGTNSSQNTFSRENNSGDISDNSTRRSSSATSNNWVSTPQSERDLVSQRRASLKSSVISSDDEDEKNVVDDDSLKGMEVQEFEGVEVSDNE